MSLTRFTNRNDPFLGLSQWNRMFDDAFQGRDPWGWGVQSSSNTPSFFRPRFDVEDGPNDTLKATFEVPGLTKDDVHIELHKDRLTISGEHKTENERKADSYWVRERQYGKFAQTLMVPEGTKEENIQASVADGLLTVTFPKVNPQTNEGPKKITVG